MEQKASKPLNLTKRDKTKTLMCTGSRPTIVEEISSLIKSLEIDDKVNQAHQHISCFKRILL